MHLLILCRSDLLDRHVIESALAQGHDLTLFAPTKGDFHRYPEARLIVGDRLTEHYKLAGHRWDAAIDLSARTPKQMSVTTAVLASQVAHYILVSSAWVLEHPWTHGMDESAPTQRLTPEEAAADELTVDNFAGLLAECERILVDHFEGGSFVVRPGLLVGPEDPLDQLGSWMRRLSRGGEVLVPRLDFPVQFIDVRDLARWIVRAAEDQQQGTCLASGDTSLDLGGLLSEIARLNHTEVSAVEADDAWLEAQGVAPLTGLPLWMPEERGAFFTLDCGSARERGLVTRPLEETLLDVDAWDSLAALVHPETHRVGLAPRREAELLRAWREQQVPA